MQEKRRFGYLDILKIAAMMMVCMYHFPWIHHTSYVRPFPPETLVLRFFRCFDAMCVPLLMMVNGALLLNRKLDLKKHIRRMVFLFAGVYVWYVITMAAGHAWQHGIGYVIGHIRDILLDAQYLKDNGGIGVTHLWFVPMLVAVYVLVPLIHAAFNSADEGVRKGLAFFVLATAAITFPVQDMLYARALLPFTKYVDLTALSVAGLFQGNYGAMIVYFILGGYMHRMHDRLLGIPLYVCLALIACGAAGLFAEWYLVTIRNEAMFDAVFGGYSCATTLMMCVGAFAAAAKLESRWRVSEGALAGVVRLIGRNTLAVYYLHWIMGLTVMRLVSVPGCFALNFVKAAVQVLVCALLGEGLRRVPGIRALL